MRQTSRRHRGTTGTAPASRRRRGVLAGGVALALTAIVLAGCSSSSTSSGEASLAKPGTATDQFAAGAVKGAPAADGAAAGNGDGNVLADAVPLTGRALVTEASVSVEVSDVDQARTQVLAITSGSGGYIASEQTSAGQGESPSKTSVLVVRVPQARTPLVLDRLQKLGTVTSLDQSTTDVTTKVADVDARVRSAEASVRRIRTLLASAQTIGQVVTIEGQLSQRQADLESLQAQQRALKDATTDATITVSLTQRSHAAVVASGSGFVNGLRNGWDAFTTVLSGALTGLGWLLPFAVFLALVAAVLFGALRFTRRRASHLT